MLRLDCMRWLAVAGSLAGLFASPSIGEVQFSFKLVAHTSITTVPHAPPGYPTTFGILGTPAIDHGQVVFNGVLPGNGWQPQGVYNYSPGNLSAVADWSTPIPGGPGAYFGWFTQTSISGNNVAFAGGTPFSPGDFGIFKSTLSGIDPIAQWGTPIPGSSDTFFGFNVWGGPTISGDKVVFTGANSIFAVPRQAGVYLNNGSTLNVVADVNTPVPGGTGNFTQPGWAWSGASQISGNEVAFGGVSTTGAGVYKFDGSNLQMIADTSTPIPGGSGNFTGFNGVSISDGDVAIGVAFGGFNSPGGIYLSHNGSLQLIADQNTPTPGHEIYGMARLDGNPSLDHGNLAFTSSSPAATGLYTTLGGQLIKVIDTTDSLGGNGLGGFGISQQAISGNQIAFLASLADQSSAIYVATRTDIDTQTVDVTSGQGSVQFTNSPQIMPPVVRWRPFNPDVDVIFRLRRGRLISDNIFLGSDFEFSNLDFPHAGTETTLWNLDVSNETIGPFTIEFPYDPLSLEPGVDEGLLGIYHYTAGAWELEPQTIDLVNHVITVQTTTLSPFALGMVPEPASMLTMALACLTMALGRHRRLLRFQIY